ncbi:polyprenol phosphomannose-dependent alpha 1,6 mannosyltransferase MptB [Actinoplanes sp. KI2]|uniref:polyprenol phosphomannose-dependent alpha 1,6 mannosyltransferase MptB n=1 Tax=Actinoplanes sp. KI2 TaxID=2983315 RepID=UPI0021D591DF|nr:polyprenol phosphomannose-dependent alpha 1,6 mannosyltransferase MptB [Actinoplanes sp. KI2]MCU7722207.1 polyprenol phosphomannose-dependent alpha 1,6 mannosyltransferase MptB [Actinoplanes sp. KI2]
MARLVQLRYLGLAAAVLLAVVAWLGGALPHGNLAATPLTIATGPHGPGILLGWLVGTAIFGYAWWAARDRVPSGRWALRTAALWAAPFLVIPPDGSRDVYSYACQGYLYAHGISPYTHGIDALDCPWIDGVSPIWRDTAAPYGPLFVLLSAAGVRVAGGSLVLIVVFFRLLTLLGLVGVAAGLPVLARRCGIPPARAWWVALAGPLVGVHLIGGAHNDALMIGLVVAGLALVTLGAPLDPAGPFGAARSTGALGAARSTGALGAARSTGALGAARSTGALGAARSARSGGAALSARSVGAAAAGLRPGAAVGRDGWGCLVVGGLLLGLAVAIKVTAIVVVPFAVLLVLARPYRWRQALLAGGLVGGGAAAAMLGVTIASGLGYGWVGAMVDTRDLVQFTSPPTAVGMTATYLGRLVYADFDAVPVVRVLAFLLFVLLVVALCWRSARWGGSGDRLGATGRFLNRLGGPAGRAADAGASALRGAALALSATVALAPYFHPWYAYWPLALLAATTIRTGLIMATATAGPLLVLADGSGLARFVKFPGAPLMTLLLIGLLVWHLRPAQGPRRPVMPEPARIGRPDVASTG